MDAQAEVGAIGESDPYPFATFVRHDEEHGHYVLLPDWSGFGPDESVIMQVAGDKLTIWRKGDPDAPVLDH